MDLGLQNKRVLVTGASQGIGLGIAISFLQEGSKVCIVSRGSEKLYKSKQKLDIKFDKKNVLLEKCDFTRKHSIKLLEKRIKKKLGGIDVLVANVGNGASVPEPVPNEAQWEETWNVNFNSALFTARSFMPMLRDSKGSLLFISSIAGIEAFGAPVDYSTSKTAIISFAKNVSRKLAKEVRVNVIAPGNIWFSNGTWDKKMKTNKKQVDKILSSVPMERFGTPKEIGDAAAFLCSERAEFITGSTLVIDGGQTVGIL
jgi:3-oxoacyl-[acyl-carrier protein] reductase